MMKQLFYRIKRKIFRNKKNLNNDSTSLYNQYLNSPKDYWESKGLVNKKMIDSGKLQQRDKIMTFLKNFSNTVKKCEPTSILEAGVGYGRVIRLLRDNLSSLNYIAGSDLSSSQIKNAKRIEQTIKNKQNIIHYKVADTCNLSYENNRFDVVYTYGSLMHIPPSSIKDAIKELLRVAKKYLIICETQSDEHVKKTIRSFVHQYKDIVEALKVAKLEQIITKNIGLSNLNYKLFLFKINEEV